MMVLFWFFPIVIALYFLFIVANDARRSAPVFPAAWTNKKKLAMGFLVGLSVAIYLGLFVFGISLVMQYVTGYENALHSLLLGLSLIFILLLALFFIFGVYAQSFSKRISIIKAVLATMTLMITVPSVIYFISWFFALHLSYPIVTFVVMFLTVAASLVLMAFALYFLFRNNSAKDSLISKF